jgi:hypothetical protein
MARICPGEVVVGLGALLAGWLGGEPLVIACRQVDDLLLRALVDGE